MPANSPMFFLNLIKKLELNIKKIGVIFIPSVLKTSWTP